MLVNRSVSSFIKNVQVSCFILRSQTVIHCSRKQEHHFLIHNLHGSSQWLVGLTSLLQPSCIHHFEKCLSVSLLTVIGLMFPWSPLFVLRLLVIISLLLVGAVLWRQRSELCAPRSLYPLGEVMLKESQDPLLLSRLPIVHEHKVSVSIL